MNDLAIAPALANICQGFSCPGEQLDEAVLEAIACAYARGAVERFTHQFGSLLEERGRGLTRLIDAWLSRDLNFDDVWEPIFGTIGEILAGRSLVTALDAGARLGLTIQEHGVIGDWSLSFDSCIPLRWGRWPLPDSETIAVWSDGQHATIETGSGSTRQTHQMRRTSIASWDCCDDGLFAYPQVPVEKRTITFLLRDSLRAPEFAYLQDELAPESSWQELSGRFLSSFELLRQYAPEYLTWVDRVMRYVIPLEGGPGRIVSGSTRGETGVSHISSYGSAPQLAEMLVHESAHQYYYILTRLQAVDDGSDRILYYSPIKGRGRHIHYIHLAFHAFANVVVLGRITKANGFPDPAGYFASNEEQLLPQLEQLEKALNTTHSLTPMGRALWHPLSERLKAVS